LKSIVISQAGEEFNGLALLLANADQYRGDISAAFIQPSLPNSIYIEARSPLVIQRYLGLFSSSISWHKGVHLVPLQERVQLLSMRSGKLGEDVGDWVRIKRGTYRRDLGYVLRVDDLKSQVRLLLVPRITYKSGTLKSQAVKHSKTQRPLPALLDLNLAQTVDGSQRLDGLKFKGMVFMDRLLVKDYAPHDLITTNVRPTYEEIKLFRGCKAVDGSAIREWEIADATKALCVDDRVEVLVGELKGCCGLVLDIRDEIAKVEVQQEGPAMPREKYLLDVPLRHVRKAFRDGDFVEIRHGGHAGVVGYVISVSTDALMATLYRYDTDSGLDMTSQASGFMLLEHHDND
jgi:transcription elongation factor